jgi:hypothetical protein
MTEFDVLVSAEFDMCGFSSVVGAFFVFRLVLAGMEAEQVADQHNPGSSMQDRPDAGVGVCQAVGVGQQEVWAGRQG